MAGGSSLLERRLKKSRIVEEVIQEISLSEGEKTGESLKESDNGATEHHLSRQPSRNRQVSRSINYADTPKKDDEQDKSQTPQSKDVTQ